MMRTYNFKVDPPTVMPKNYHSGEFRDYRNGFVCVNPTLDLECYLNYIQLLNLHRDKWKSFGYLDLGMMPLVMGPSFMHSLLIETLVPMINIFEISCYSMYPTSVMYSACKLGDNDIWLFKDDVQKKTGIPADKLTLERLIRWCKYGELPR